MEKTEREVAVIEKEELRRYFGPCVYAIWKNNKCIYVGASRRGLSRVFSPTHHIKIEAIEPDRIEFYWCENEEEAYNLEGDLLETLIPKLNKTKSRVRKSPIRRLYYQASKLLNVKESILERAVKGQL